MSPLLKGLNDYQHLFIIVMFNHRQKLTKEYNRMLLVVLFRLLEQNYFSYKVRAVYFDPEWCWSVWRD